MKVTYITMDDVIDFLKRKIKEEQDKSALHPKGSGRKFNYEFVYQKALDILLKR